MILLFVRRFSLTPICMARSLLLTTLVLILFAPAAAQPVTGLSDWSLYLDPGHSQNENVGVFGYSEAHKVLRVGLELRDLLLTETDIDTVYLSRTTDAEQVGLSQRVDHANTVGADYYHSIHSNAAGPSTNFVFVLWPQLPSGSEPLPPYDGGRRMAEFMGPLLGTGMRIPASNNGAWGECDFYGASDCRSAAVTPKGSRNYVQSFSLMPSTLSEAGFHTNPTQNQRNMNADWKQLEARAMFWAILQYAGLERPAERIATGIISDVESGRPINGATITIGDATYTTDTFASLFNRYSSDPDELRNGFYYLPDLPPGPLSVTVEAEDYESFTGTLTPTDTFFTFFDVELVSTVPPVVASSSPEDGAELFPITSPLSFTFSRQMDPESVEAAFSIAPEVDGSFAWSEQNTRLVFEPDTLLPETSYTVTIAGSAEGAYGDALDGDGDGTGGDAFSLSFTTGFPDTEPPRIVAATPGYNEQGVDLRPVVTLTYSERLDPATLEGRVRLEPAGGGAAVPGTVEYYNVGAQSAVSFFPEATLSPETGYRLVVEPGVEDLFRNAQPTRQQTLFTTGSDSWAVTPLDDFEGAALDRWWQPQESGSTAGIVTDSTAATPDAAVANLLYGGDTSLRLDYGWNPAASPHLIRLCFENCESSSVTFDSTYALQAYVFGDGSGNGFRFAVDDAGGTEVSPWFTVDWIGWRLVSWNMGGEVGSWIGNGSLDGALRFESLQLTYTPESPAYGRFWVDDLRIAQRVTTSSEEPVAGTPERFRVHAAYPNPFADRTTISFDLPAAAPVSVVVYDVRGAEVARLADGEPHTAGTHTLGWDARGLASGVYVGRVTAGEAQASFKMMVVR